MTSPSAQYAGILTNRGEAFSISSLHLVTGRERQDNGTTFGYRTGHFAWGRLPIKLPCMVLVMGVSFRGLLLELLGPDVENFSFGRPLS